MGIDWNKFKSVDSMEVNRTWPAKGQELVEGDTIQGRYIEEKKDIGPNKSKMYVLEDDLGVVGVWGGTVLDTKFLGITPGQLVAIEYIGTGKAAAGKRPYKNFRVGVANDGEAIE